MGQAKLYGQNTGGFDINGIIEDYYVYAGESISAGDFVEFINGVASQTTKTSSNTQLSDVASTGIAISSVLLDNGNVFIAHRYGSSMHLYGMVCTVNNGTITKGTDTTLSTETNSGRTISTLLLSSGKVFIAHCSDSNYKPYGMVATITGTTITVNTDTQLSNNVNSKQMSATSLGNDKIFISHGGANGVYLYGIVCSVSGTSISLGTDTAIVSSSDRGTYNSSVALSSSKVFVAYGYASTYGIIASISGTTITGGTGKEFSGGSLSSALLLPTGKVLVIFSNTGGLRGVVCSVSNTTISTGTVTVLNIGLSSDSVSSLLLSSGKVFITHNNSQKTYLCGSVATISDSTITINSTTSLISLTDSSQSISSALLLSDGNMLIAHSKSGNYNLYAQEFAVSDNVPTNKIITTNYETQVRKATTSEFYGIAKTKGIGGTSTGHKDKISVYKSRDYYIESTGTQYIDTGIVPNSKTRMRIKFKLNRTDVAQGMGWGSSESQENFQISCIPAIGFRTGVSSSYQTKVAKDTLDTEIHIFDLQSGSQKFDGVEYATDIIGDTAVSGQTLYLFSHHAEWTTALDGPCYINLYSCEIWENGVLVRDFAPSIDPNGVVCLYDRVSKTYFYNKGTGEFLFGNQYHKKVEYLESTGTQYIDTGIVPTVETMVKFRMSSSSQQTKLYPQLFGSQVTANGNNRFGVTYKWIARTGSSNMTATNVVYDKPIDGSLKLNEFILDGATYKGAETFTPPTVPIYLFATNVQSDSTPSLIPDTLSVAKLYYMKIWQGENLVRDYIPVVDSKGVACLYDQVSKTYFYNKGTGEFLTNINK